MHVLLIRYDSDGSTFYDIYDNDPVSAEMMTGAVAAHLNTIGVVKLELIPAHQMVRAHVRQRRTSQET